MVLLTGVLQFNTLRVPDTSASLHDVRTAQGTEEEQAIPARVTRWILCARACKLSVRKKS